MAHPFNSVRQGKVEHSRAGHLTRDYATGGPTDYNDPTPRLRTDQDKPSEVRHPRAHFAAGGAVTERASGGRIEGKPAGAKKGGSPTSSKTATKTATSTKTSTVANPKGNVTVTGGAGDGDTKVTVGRSAKEQKPARAFGGRLDSFGGRLDGGPDERARGGRTNKGATVNVIVAPSGGTPGAPMAGVGAPPMAPPRPMMPPPGAGPGMPPGAPPMMPPGGPIRSSGGRTGYAKGGGVRPGPAWAEGVRNGTQPANSPGKNDTKDIGRGPVITKATGGAIEHPRKGGMGPRFDGGAGGGIARIEKEERAERRAGKPT